MKSLADPETFQAFLRLYAGEQENQSLNALSVLRVLFQISRYCPKQMIEKFIQSKMLLGILQKSLAEKDSLQCITAL